jgi:prophage antirepressor-like protein
MLHTQSTRGVTVPETAAIQPYIFPPTGQQVRSLMVDGEPWFVANDACTAVGITKPRDAVAQLDDDERASTVVDTPGGPQVMTVVSEAGVYALMMISRSPVVKPFRRWLAHEVLPSIRRTGGYSVAGGDASVPVQIQVAVNRLAELAHDEHVVPAAARILAFKRWRKPRKGIEVYVQLAIDVGSLGLDGAAAGARALPAKDRAR